MDGELTTSEAAEALDIPLGTLKGWLNKIPVPLTTDGAGKRRIGPEGLEIIKQIKALRLEDGRGMATIRRRLAPDASEIQDEAVTNPDPVAADLLAIVREQAAEIAELNKRLTEVSMIAAQYQERAGNLGDQVKLLTSGKEAPRPWWKIW